MAERVFSQLPLKDKAFLIFLGQNPPFALRAKTGVSLAIFLGLGFRIWLNRLAKLFLGCRRRTIRRAPPIKAFLPPDEQITCRAGVIGDENLSIKPIRRLAAGKLGIKGAR